MMRAIICALVGHDYFVLKHFTPYSRKLGCHRCRRAFGMNDDARAVIPWSPELEAMYRLLGTLPKRAQPDPDNNGGK